MAPEQANFNAVDIDTRADVYALGVILYELLTGSTPISRETIKKAALDEMMKLIREQEAPTPSSRLSSSETKPTVAANRHSEPQKLGRYIKGELDWIVMKALSKERDRRYETANGFAKDIERFLNHEAVLAGPASAGYRLRKFVKRNSGKVLAAGLIILTLLGGIAGTTWGLVKATQQEHLANERARAEQQAREQAQIRLTQIEKNNQLITSIFDDVDITKIKKGKEPLEAVLARRLVKVAEQLDGETVGDPIMVADLQNKLGESLLHLGFATDAIPLFRKARDTQHVILGTNHHDTLASMNNLALSYREAGQFEKAIPLYEETLPLMQKVMGINHVDTLVSMSNLAEIYRATGKKNKALLLAEETLQLMKVKLGADHPLTITSLVNTAAAYQTAGQYEKALSFSKEALDRMSARQGLEHPDTLNSMSNLASIYLDLGEFDKAVALFESCLSLRRKIVGADHPDTLLTMNNLAMAYSDAGQNDKASRLYQEALEAIQKKLGSDHPLALVNLNNLASSYRDAGELDKALPLFEKASQGIEKLLFQYEHSDRIITNTIQAYERAKQYEKAVSWRSKWGIVVKQREGAESLQYVNELEGLGSNYLQQGKWTEAEQVLRTAWGIREKIKSEGWMNYRAQFMLGNALLGQKKYDEAEPLLLKGYEGMKQREKTIPQQSKIRLTEALDRLIQLYTETNKPDEVKIWQAVKGKLAKPVEKKN